MKETQTAAPDTDRRIALAAIIDEVATSVEWPHDVGNVVAEWITDGVGRNMTSVEAASVELLRHRLQWLASGSWEVRYMHAGRSILDKIPDEDLAAVAEVLPLLKAPLAIAELGDVLWAERIGDAPYTSAKAALSAHLAIIASSGHLGHVRRRSAQRAADLTLSLGAPTQSAADAISTLIADRHDLNQHNLVGVVAAFVTVADAPEALEALSLVEANIGDPLLTVEIARLKHGVSPEGSPSNFDLAISRLSSLDPNIDAARAHFMLRKAVQLAQEVNWPGHEALRAQLQKSNPFEGADPLRTESQISLSDVDRHAQQIVGTDSFYEAMRRLHRWSLGIQPTTALAGEESDFLNSLSGEVLGAHGSTTRSDVQGSRAQSYRHVTAQFTFQMFEPALSRCFDAYAPTIGEIAEFIQAATPATPAAARVLADGLRLFGEERFESSANTIIPRLEQVVRTIAVDHDVVVTKDPIGDRRGGVKTLGEVLRAMLNKDDSGLSNFTLSRLDFFLTDDLLGFNIRNSTLHGLNSERAIEGWEATLVVFALLDVLFDQEEE